MSLETNGLAIGYDHDLITGISIKVQPGKIVTLIGPNGSGKSTILKTVTGLLKKRAGVIFLDGCDRSDLSGKDAAKKISMVMTNRIDPELMTCREVIESARYPYTGVFGKLSAKDRKKADEAIEATDTSEIAETLFTNISDGQRQRVMLARSLCQDPDILVLDEPTSFLDIRYRIDILTRIKDLAKRRNIGILMSVHEPETAMKLSDHVIAVGPFFLTITLSPLYSMTSPLTIFLPRRSSTSPLTETSPLMMSYFASTPDSQSPDAFNT